MAENLNAEMHRRVAEAWETLTPAEQERATELLEELDRQSAWWTDVGEMFRQIEANYG